MSFDQNISQLACVYHKIKLEISNFIIGRDDPNSGTLKMSSAYYFKGDCNDLEVQAELKERFITVVSNPVNFLKSFCAANKNCKVENIQVFCGSVDASRRRRRKRSTLEMEVRFLHHFFENDLN